MRSKRHLSEGNDEVMEKKKSCKGLRNVPFGGTEGGRDARRARLFDVHRSFDRASMICRFCIGQNSMMTK